tara:strand:- start:2425 stop:2781 length:357 start_codon:yes stop_codon:yes gene_type:complete
MKHLHPPKNFKIEEAVYEKGDTYLGTKDGDVFGLRVVTGDRSTFYMDNRSDLKLNYVHMLRIICRHLCITNYSKLKKSDLVDIIYDSGGKKSTTRHHNVVGRCVKNVIKPLKTKNKTK